MSRLLCAVSLLLLIVANLGWTWALIPSSLGGLSARHYDSIFSFGDSFADTGNNPVVFAENAVFNPVTRPPYGSTYFGRPTGRDSDGRLIIDFIAQRLGLPLVPPSLAHNGSFRRGANFAVGGATALDAAFFHGDKFPLNISLGVQLEWFESLKPSLCRTTRECEEFFGRSLFFVGEFGVNDYHFSFAAKSVQEIMSFVPDVIGTISTAIEAVSDRLIFFNPAWAEISLGKRLWTSKRPAVVNRAQQPLKPMYWRRTCFGEHRFRLIKLVLNISNAKRRGIGGDAMRQGRRAFLCPRAWPAAASSLPSPSTPRRVGDPPSDRQQHSSIKPGSRRPAGEPPSSPAAPACAQTPSHCAEPPADRAFPPFPALHALRVVVVLAGAASSRPWNSETAAHGSFKSPPTRPPRRAMPQQHNAITMSESQI